MSYYEQVNCLLSFQNTRADRELSAGLCGEVFFSRLDPVQKLKKKKKKQGANFEQIDPRDLVYFICWIPKNSMIPFWELSFQRWWRRSDWRLRYWPVKLIRHIPLRCRDSEFDVHVYSVESTAASGGILVDVDLDIAFNTACLIFANNAVAAVQLVIGARIDTGDSGAPSNCAALYAEKEWASLGQGKKWREKEKKKLGISLRTQDAKTLTRILREYWIFLIQDAADNPSRTLCRCYAAPLLWQRSEAGLDELFIAIRKTANIASRRIRGANSVD